MNVSQERERCYMQGGMCKAGQAKEISPLALHLCVMQLQDCARLRRHGVKGSVRGARPGDIMRIACERETANCVLIDTSENQSQNALKDAHFY